MTHVDVPGYHYVDTKKYSAACDYVVNQQLGCSYASVAEEVPVIGKAFTPVTEVCDTASDTCTVVEIIGEVTDECTDPYVEIWEMDQGLYRTAPTAFNEAYYQFVPAEDPCR